MFVGTALSVRLLVYAGLSLFIISGPYLYVVVCVLYAYNLTILRDTTPLIRWHAFLANLTFPSELIANTSIELITRTGQELSLRQDVSPCG